MASIIKKIIIFAIVAGLVIAAYIFFFKNTGGGPALSSSSTSSPVFPASAEESTMQTSKEDVSQEFLALLLNVNRIDLKTGIFSDPAFATLKDSTITLMPEGNEGRPNPFAPIGSDPITSNDFFNPLSGSAPLNPADSGTLQ